MRRITLATASVTTRKRRRHPLGAGAAVALALLAAGLAGCSTPGPLHLYSMAPRAADIHDVAVDSADPARNVPSFLQPGDRVTGFAYDPFTDHFFLRLTPGNRILVVDRPARRIKREFTIAEPSLERGGDIAVSPRDGHLYLLNDSGSALVETNRFGQVVRSITLGNVVAAAVAFDAERAELLVLAKDGRTLDRLDASGTARETVTLERAVAPSLAYDADGRRLYAPLARQTEIGVFDDAGKLVRTMPLRPGDQFIDAGPHSFLRVF